MNFVQPIRDANLVRDIINYLKKWNEKYCMMFLLGIYTGRRVTDILKLKVKDVKDKDQLIINREIKTGKTAVIEFNPDLKKALKEYCADKEPDDYLIKSNKGMNKPLTRQSAYSVLRHTAKIFGLEQIGTHSMRKTFGYHLYYASKKDVVMVMNAIGHSSEAITLRYIGVTGEQVNAVVKMLKF